MGNSLFEYGSLAMWTAHVADEVVAVASVDAHHVIALGMAAAVVECAPVCVSGVDEKQQHIAGVDKQGNNALIPSLVRRVLAISMESMGYFLRRHG